MDELPLTVAPGETTPSVTTSSPTRWLFILGGVALVLVVGVIVAFLWISRETVTVTDYGSDLEGFMQAVQTCAPAHVMYTTTLDMTLFNFNQTSTSLYALKGMNETLCVLYTELLNSSRTFASELPPEMVARNLEMDAQMRGLNTTCSYSLDALARMFADLRMGTIGSDYGAICDGQGWQEITLPAQTTFPENTSALPPSDLSIPPAFNVS